MRLALFIALAVALGMRANAQERNILDEEVRNNESLISEIKRLNKREGLANGSAVIQQWEDDTALIKERNGRFKGRATSRQFTVYAETQETADRYLKEAHAVLTLYQKLFTRANFLPATPAQILIYNNEFDYVRYEKIPRGVVGHTHATRSKKKAIIKHGSLYSIEAVTSSNVKDHRLATYQQEVPYVFAHEVSHILTYELVNPGRTTSIKDIEPSLFLNEGLAEYFSTRLHPEGLEQRLGVLRETLRLAPQTKVEDIKDVPLTDFLKRDAYPEGVHVLEFYSEAVLFSHWLMELPEGPELMSALLLSTDVDQMESQLRHHQRKINAPVTGWEAYQPYRKEMLIAPRAKP